MRQTPLRPPLFRPIGNAVAQMPPRPARTPADLPAPAKPSQRPRRPVIQPRVTIHSRAVLGLALPADESQNSLPADPTGILHPVLRFFTTLLLALLALAGAAVVALGTHPLLARYPSGMGWIITSRRMQWPLTALCLALCVALIALVIAGKRRAVWLVFLAPILFLFYQRFAGEDFRRMAILDNPPFVPMEKASFLQPDSPVIGLTLDGESFAYPCGALALAPVIVHADADKRVLLMYSPYAGRAQAFIIDNTVKPRELDIVSMPADALLLYNSRIGQFINGFTGLTVKGDRPEGFRNSIETHKTTWRQWWSQYPDTKVLATSISQAGEKTQPHFPSLPVKFDLPADARIALIATSHPVGIQSKNVGPNDLLNCDAGGTSLLLFRDKSTGRLCAFDRSIKGDLFPKFIRKSIAKKPDVAFYDADTDSLWNIEGRCIAGNAKGEQLRPLAIEEDLPYATLKSFYPNLEMIKTDRTR